MRRSTTSSVFPDINVWVALSLERHLHHSVASDWFDDLDRDTSFFFCRFTQLGLLRLWTTVAVMAKDVMTQQEAWTAYDRFFGDQRIAFLEEPPTLETHFRVASRRRHPAPKDWADCYFVAFAEAAGLTLVTFDRALKAKSKSAVLLAE